MCKRLIFLTSFVLMLSLVCNVSGQGTGTIMREVWSDIGGTAVSDLMGNANYPDNPTFGDELTLFEAPTDFADNFGSRVYGWLHPATSGDYTFWIAADDYCQLSLSTDDDPANAVVIAGHNSWTGSREFDNMPEQMSAPIALEAGGKYYIEGIYKEGGGGDNMAVAWQGPDSPERTVIDGSFLSPAPWNPVLKRAKDPNPADGAVDADTASLEWAAGPTSVSYKVYLSADATIDESELVAETDLTIYLTALDMGAAYYWRVDAVEADGTVIEGALWSFTTLPLEAHFPSPADGARNIESGTKLSWTAGKGVIMHDVYFGADEAAVAAGDPSTFKGKVMVTSFDPGALELFTTYYWKVDEFSVTGTNPGPVWSFSTPEYIVIQSGEATLNYDNTADPFVSELALDVPADLRFGGVGDLTLRFQGGAASEGSVSMDEAAGTYTITGSGADIWGSSDQFHYVYRELTGDGEIVAQVVSNGTGSNTWAKGGVMIRETLDADSKHMLMGLTGGDGGGIAFQGRMETGGNSTSYHGDVTAAPPYWVRLSRVGNTITAYASADGVTWDLFTDTSPDGAHTNPIDIEMADPVLIGLFVTSHAAGEKRTYEFDNVGINGDITEVTMNTDVGIPGNAPAPIYVTLEDTTGAVASVTHGNPAATNIESPRQWTIPLDKFKGVDASSAAKLYIGVGDGQPGGTGTITIADVFVVKPAGAGNIIWVSGFYDDNADGAPDDQEWVDLLTAAGHAVDYNPGWLELDDAQIAALNAADLVIVSRNSNSGDYANDAAEIAQWNAITTPIILSSTHIIRNSRWNWVNSSTILSLTPTMVLADGTEIPGIDAAVGTASFIDTDPGNGTVSATGDGLPFIIEWEAGVEFYDGAGQTAGGPRVFFVAGTQEDAATGVGRGEMNLSPEALAVFMDTVDMLLPAVSNDVTKPGDIVKGVPDDGDWPGGEYPALAIDDNTGTKFLHFKGPQGITGIKVTPLDGASVVTGLTFTTANDATERDPVAYELSGSNDSIDGPFTLIASGDIVDFGGADAWPRFTKNETPISFNNAKAYSHYQVLFTAVRDAGSANSMQIAEIELIGVPAAEGPIAAMYEFENNAADSSGNGLNGTIMGDPMFVEAQVGMGLLLDGVDDYVDLGNPSSLDFGTGDFAIAAWINLTAIERATVFAKGGDNGGGIRYTLAMGESNDNKMTLTTDDDSSKKLALGNTVVNDGAWHHVVGMRKGNMSLVYVDGAFDGSIDLPEGYDLSGSSQHNALIGAITSHTDGSLEKLFAGTIDDVRIYRRALSDDEVSNLAGGQAPTNILANGGLEDGVMDPWSTYGDLVTTAEVVQVLEGAAVPEDPIEGSSCLHVVVADAGANFWDAGLQHAGHVFEAGKSYTLSVYMKSKSGTLDINIKPERGQTRGKDMVIRLSP